MPLQAAITNNAPRAMLNLLITNGARLTPSENGLSMNFAVDKTAGKGQALGASSKVLSADAIARAQITWNWVTGAGYVGVLCLDMYIYILLQGASGRRISTTMMEYLLKENSPSRTH